MATGMRAVETRFAAFCDADTIYPADYLATADRLLRNTRGAVAALGIYVPTGAAHAHAAMKERRRVARVARILPQQSHTGGAGYCVCTQTYRRVGGYDETIWPFVLFDHELIHRMSRHGRILHHADLYCETKPRRGELAAVRWTLTERIAYHATPGALRNWFFYSFLWKRFERRGMWHVNLRNRVID